MLGIDLLASTMVAGNSTTEPSGIDPMVYHSTWSIIFTAYTVYGSRALFGLGFVSCFETRSYSGAQISLAYVLYTRLVQAPALLASTPQAIVCKFRRQSAKYWRLYLSFRDSGMKENKVCVSEFLFWGVSGSSD